MKVRISRTAALWGGIMALQTANALELNINDNGESVVHSRLFSCLYTDTGFRKYQTSCKHGRRRNGAILHRRR